jgi:hypothetical protein
LNHFIRKLVGRPITPSRLREEAVIVVTAIYQIARLKPANASKRKVAIRGGVLSTWVLRDPWCEEREIGKPAAIEPRIFRWLPILSRFPCRRVLQHSVRPSASAVLGRACSGIRNGWTGRRLDALFKKAGMREVEVRGETVNVRSFEVADLLLDLRVVADHALAEGLIAEHAASKWIDDLMENDASNTFFATITVFVGRGRKSFSDDQIDARASASGGKLRTQ